MRAFFAVFFFLLSIFAMPTQAACTIPLLDHSLLPLSQPQPQNLCDAYAGKVILVVNTASACGFTPQFKDLEALYQKYKDKGLVVLGFPSNDFFQEQKDDKSVAEFCHLNYGVTFPMFSKTAVRGKNANPFYQALIAESGKSPKWNFYKYLIDRQGKVVNAFASTTKPLDSEIEKQIQGLL
jgi:glutathione peroxidase